MEVTKLTPEERKAYNLFEPNFRSGNRINYVKVTANVSKGHFMRICSKAYDLVKDGSKIMTDLPFVQTMGRSDLTDLTYWKIYEATDSETEEELKEKIKKYPDLFDVIRLNVRR